MARETFEDWIPVETGDRAIQALLQYSVTERIGRPENMASDTKQIPRSGDFAIAAVAKGASYGETSGTNGYVEMIARKVGGIIRIAEEDLVDSTVDILATKRVDAARNMALFFDNATLGCSAAANGTTVLYTSVYKAVRTTDSAVSYTADDNYVSSSTVTYDNLSATLGTVEDSVWFDESNLFVAASPTFKAQFRGIKDTSGVPIFQDGTNSSPARLFGYPVEWTIGARTSHVNTYTPAGNPLLIIGNRNLLIKGMAKLSPQISSTNPGFAIQRAINGQGFTTDEALMKAAMRRGFVVGAAPAFAVYEKTE
jgi:HK97 family phage major capsid protein